jgi:putative thioredoxin
VLDQSHQMPVMVDFWAAWCGPCLMLEPIIVQLAEENKHRIRFVKVNTDENPELADRYRIMSIPAIQIFNNGDVVASFNGLMYKPDFERWLNDHLPDENRTKLIEIKQRISEGYTDAVRLELEELLQKAPYMLEAKVLLSSFYIFEDPQHAAELVSGVQPGSPLFAQADAVRQLSELEAIRNRQNELEKGEGREEVVAASEYLFNKQLEPAIENLLSVVTLNREYHKGIADRALVAIFTVLGNSHPITKEYRERYDLINT